MHKLDRISLKLFKFIREMRPEVRLLNVLIGGNGAGKSNFISAFRILIHLVEAHLQPFVGKACGADALLHFGQRTTDRIGFEMSFGVNEYRCAPAPSARDSFIFEEEVCLFESENFHQPHLEDLEGGHKESRMEELAEFPVWGNRRGRLAGASGLRDGPHRSPSATSRRTRKRKGAAGNSEVVRVRPACYARFDRRPQSAPFR